MPVQKTTNATMQSIGLIKTAVNFLQVAADHVAMNTTARKSDNGCVAHKAKFNPN